MCLCFVVLLGVAAVLSSAANSSQITPQSVASCSLTAGEHNVPISRFLRTAFISETDGEERTFSIKSIPGADSVSTFVNKQKLAWWLRNGKPAEEVFGKLKLTRTGKTILEDPRLVAWVKYVDDYNLNHPEKTMSTIPTLVKMYGDKGLAKMLEAAKQVESTKEIATKLQIQHLEVWRDAGYTTDKVFATLKLAKNDGAGLFANPGLNVWIRYADEFNPGEKTTLFQTLQTHFTKARLSELLIAAKRVQNREKLATRLQTQQLDDCLARRESPDAVFKLLLLDKETDNIFANPQCSTWLEYATRFKRENPHVKTAPVIDTLSAHYTDIALSRMIMTAKETSGTKMMSTYMEKKLLEKWAKDGKPPAYASELLWASVADKTALEAAYLENLVVHSTKHVASDLQTLQIGAWLGKHETPDTVFKLLLLDKETENIFARPQYRTWLEYATTFKRENPDAKTVPVFETLLVHYNDVALSRMIKTAKETSGTKLIGMHIEMKLLEKWATDGKAPAYVLNKLGTTKEDKERLLSAFMQQIRRAESEAV